MRSGWSCGWTLTMVLAGGLACEAPALGACAALTQPVVERAAFEEQFRTGYEPGEASASPADAHTWMTFTNTSTRADATPWAMSVYYESPGDVNDRSAGIIPIRSIRKSLCFRTG